MTKFADLGLPQAALDAVTQLGYTTPTPVQEQAIPLVLAGRDIIAAAKTGTGKTAAFALPALAKLGAGKGRKHPRMLVITPTRELASQIAEVCGVVARETGQRTTSVVGGVGIEPQRQRLAKGVDVLIATPGRLIDLMNQKAVNLSRVELLVLDEADRMLDMGFLPSVTKIVEATPAERQTLLFSATVDESITKQVGFLLRDPALVRIAVKGETADTVEQRIARIPHLLKPALLTALLRERGSERVIVFARTRHRADSCCRKLKRAGFSAEAIHSDRSQNQRARALANFASGATDVLVATDVLARGIDVQEVSYVVNFDLPGQAEDYVHRIGRTGRAGAQGFAVSFVSPENAADLAAIEKFIKRKIPEMDVEGFDLEAAATEAAERSARAEAKRDPELAEAAREHAKMLRRKEKGREKAKQAQQAAKPGAKQAAKPSAKPAAKQGAKPPAKPAAKSAAKQPAKPSPKQGAARKGSSRPAASAKPAADTRPGRARRAAVAEQRKSRRRDSPHR